MNDQTESEIKAYVEGHKAGFTVGHAAGYEAGRVTGYDNCKERAWIGVEIVLSNASLATETKRQIREHMQTQIGIRA